MWEVKRHGGNKDDKHLLVMESMLEHMARRVYEREKKHIKQGSVILVHNNKVIAEARAPKTNTRW